MTGNSRHDFDVILPHDFEVWATITEAKGWLPGVIVVAGGKRFALTFYDPVRLAQDVLTDLSDSHHFFFPNLVVIPTVTRKHIEAAIATMVASGRLSRECVPSPDQ